MSDWQNNVEEVIKYPATIGLLSKTSGCSLDSIRHYEEIGLLQGVARSTGGHRFYQEKHYERLIFIRKCRSLEFSLNEIHWLIDRIDENDIVCNKIEEVFIHHLSDIRNRINQLRCIERILEKITCECSPSASDCPAIKALLP